MADIFTIAKAAYDDSIEDLRRMTKLFEMALADYDGRVTLNQFDILLQYSLLQVALADGYLHVGECMFIKDLAQYSDFCIFLNQNGFHNVTWADIYNTRESYLNRLLDDAKELIVDLSKDFITVFANVDSITEYDYLSDLKRNVTAMVLATCQADGKAEAIELSNGCLIFNALEAIEQRKEKLIASEKKSKAKKTTENNSSKKTANSKK